MTASAAQPVVRCRVWVSGRVQNVWFRDSCAQQARAHGVSGSVRNLADGRVEAVFEGPEVAVQALVAWCRTGPPRARVNDLAVQGETPVGEDGFSVA